MYKSKLWNEIKKESKSKEIDLLAWHLKTKKFDLIVEKKQHKQIKVDGAWRCTVCDRAFKNINQQIGCLGMKFIAEDSDIPSDWIRERNLPWTGIRPKMNVLPVGYQYFGENQHKATIELFFKVEDCEPVHGKTKMSKREREWTHAVQEAQKQGLKPLEGSFKQVVFAESVRFKMMESARLESNWLGDSIPETSRQEFSLQSILGELLSARDPDVQRELIAASLEYGCRLLANNLLDAGIWIDSFLSGGDLRIHLLCLARFVELRLKSQKAGNPISGEMSYEEYTRLLNLDRAWLQTRSLLAAHFDVPAFLL